MKHDHAAPVTSIPVWDLPTRLFHWSLAASVGTALVTGFLGPPSWLSIHLAAGYAMAGLVAFRIIWGFCGSEYSRFDSFRVTGRTVIAHLRSLPSRLTARDSAADPPHYPGHNPAGAVMIVALLAVLAALAATGLFTLGGTEKQGPFAGLVGYALGREAKDLHEALALVILAMIAGHLAGVALESRLGGENLVRAMISGRKHRPAAMAPDGSPRPAQPGRALAACAVVALVAGMAVVALGRVFPITLPTPPVLPALARECGACHWAYHPSLLPASSWRTLMTGLDDHFGENAGLPPATVAAISDHLVTYAAEVWDTKAGNRLRRVDPAQPISITATPFWKGRHRDIPDAIFARKAVAGRGNCIACHRDAGTGLFAAQQIHIPLEEERKTP